jgi:hypothetical protein
VISEDEMKYFAGRMSGPLTGGNPNIGYSHDHRVYDAAIEDQLRKWKASKNSGNYSPKQVVDNFKVHPTNAYLLSWMA